MKPLGLDTFDSPDEALSHGRGAPSKAESDRLRHIFGMTCLVASAASFALTGEMIDMDGEEDTTTGPTIQHIQASQEGVRPSIDDILSNSGFTRQETIQEPLVDEAYSEVPDLASNEQGNNEQLFTIHLPSQVGAPPLSYSTWQTV